MIQFLATLRSGDRRRQAAVFLLASVALFFIAVSARAHGIEGQVETLDLVVRQNTERFLGIAILLLVFFLGIAIHAQDLYNERLKQVLFGGIVVTVLAFTFYAAGATIRLNMISETGGPVHWHADFELYSCGEKLDLVDPKGWSNKVGTPVLHEHGDDRIHVEGVLEKTSSASLGNFFEVVGGVFSDTSFTIPLADGTMEQRANGDQCPDGLPGYLQTFVYTTHDGVITQQKLSEPHDYVLSPYETVPPGDCIIMEFGPEKDSTDKVCLFHQLRVDEGKFRFE